MVRFFFCLIQQNPVYEIDGNDVDDLDDMIVIMQREQAENVTETAHVRLLNTAMSL